VSESIGAKMLSEGRIQSPESDAQDVAGFSFTKMEGYYGIAGSRGEKTRLD
jgi:hypothetical protein